MACFKESLLVLCILKVKRVQGTAGAALTYGDHSEYLWSVCLLLFVNVESLVDWRAGCAVITTIQSNCTVILKFV